SSVAAVIEPALQVSEIRRSTSRATADLTAYDLYLRALPMLGILDKAAIDKALGFLDQAIELDPQYGPALGLAAICHMHRMINWAEDSEAERRKGLDRAQRALRAAGDDPSILANAAFTLASFGEDIETMMPLVDR